MEKLKSHLPLSLFSLFFLKIIILPFSYPEVAVLTVLGFIAAYFEYKNSDKKLRELEKKFKEQIKTFEDHNRRIEELKGAISSLKLSAISRPLSNIK